MLQMQYCQYQQSWILGQLYFLLFARFFSGIDFRLKEITIKRNTYSAKYLTVRIFCQKFWHYGLINREGIQSQRSMLDKRVPGDNHPSVIPLFLSFSHTAGPLIALEFNLARSCHSDFGKSLFLDLFPPWLAFYYSIYFLRIYTYLGTFM